MTDPAGRELPFFVYGTLRAGEHNHDLFLRGRTSAEEPATLRGAQLYDGPGYPYAVEVEVEVGDGVGVDVEGESTAGSEGEDDGEGEGTVTGELVTAAPGHHRELTAVLDHLEEYFGPGDPRNLYVRVARDVHTARGTVAAWVYVAAEAMAAELRARGTVIPGGDWSAARSP
ncbi:gamma-glutamylcyclotransferase family protein [Streptomyces sp. NPDC002133]|uniref:gamma-glutamylcyclotransferase family protein n=1 Tax=Streptomyces sp. NPDC002133 TaxID=3154409 RepID=UPI003317167A